MPRFTAIFFGRHNAFWQPVPPTIGRLRSAGLAIFRTDQRGAVTITPKNAPSLEVLQSRFCGA